MSNGDDHPLLTARHVDNLTEALRTLNRTIVQLGETAQKQLAATKELSNLIRAAAEPEPASGTTDLPKVLRRKGPR